MRRVNGWYLFILNAYWIGLSFMWNSLHVTILPAVLLTYGGEDFKNSKFGILKFVGLVLAMIIQPLFGAISDKWSSKIGKRKPFILLGTLGDFIFLAILAFIGGLPAIFIGYIGLQITSNIAHGPVQGLLPDEVPEKQLGAASGIKTAMDMLGIIISSLLISKLITSENTDPTLSVLAIAGFLAVFAGITIFGSHEKVNPGQKHEPVHWKKIFKNVFDFKANGNKSYWTLIISRFLYLVGIYGFQTFAYYFIDDRFPNLNPVKDTNKVMAFFVVILTVSSLGAGFLGDKFGRKIIHVISGFIGGAGAVLMIFATNINQLLIFGSLMGVGVGIFMSTNWAMANQIAPAEEAGKYMGLTNLATAGSSAIVSLLMGPVIDVFNNAAPGKFFGYTVLFIFAAVLMVASSFVVSKIKEQHKQTHEAA